MAVKFTPNGILDINTDPSDLPSEIVGKVEVSGAMRQCTNLDLDSKGIAKTRRGSDVIIDGISGIINTIFEHIGDKYIFAGTNLYRNETAISTSITNAKYSCIAYNAYNSENQVIFALCGSSRLRIDGANIYQWGIEAPTQPPTLWGKLEGHTYTYQWEGTTQLSSEEIKAKITRTATELLQGYNNQYYLWDSWTYDPMYSWEAYLAQLQIDVGPDFDIARHTWTFERQQNYTDKARIGVVYTYVRKNGDVVECESNPSPATYIEADSGLWVEWTIPTDPQVTHVRIYRTTNGGSNFYYAAEFEVSVGKGALLKSDLLLGTEVEEDHDLPPAGSIVVGPDFNGYCFIAKDNLLYFCKAKQPEYWPKDYYIEVSPRQDPIQALTLVGGQLYALTKHEIYQIQGTGYNSFFPVPMKAITGAVSQESVLGIKGYGILHVAKDGLYLFTINGDNKISQDRFEPIFRGEAVGEIDYVNTNYISNCHIIQHRNRIYFFYPGGSSQYCTDCLVIDIGEQKNVVHYQWPATFSSIAIDYTENRILAGDTDGNVWELEMDDTTDDNGTAISWVIQSKDFSDQLWKYFPRYAKYDVYLASGSTATGKILLNDEVKQSHILLSRNTKARHIVPCTGDRLSIRIEGSGPAKIYMVEVD